MALKSQYSVPLLFDSLYSPTSSVILLMYFCCRTHCVHPTSMLCFNCTSVPLLPGLFYSPCLSAALQLYFLPLLLRVLVITQTHVCTFTLLCTCAVGIPCIQPTFLLCFYCTSVPLLLCSMYEPNFSAVLLLYLMLYLSTSAGWH